MLLLFSMFPSLEERASKCAPSGLGVTGERHAELINFSRAQEAK